MSANINSDQVALLSAAIMMLYYACLLAVNARSTCEDGGGVGDLGVADMVLMNTGDTDMLLSGFRVSKIFFHLTAFRHLLLFLALKLEIF
ncbi:hypothetical protein L211DRAFT_835544 [Terfezia boudieri ATCC MYA-4762]|uniref:Uncharacterized protein n=1 Tax=Terfezia boudieri ATCC MYA-4762 TaxID=1051890 RepID=A0A3N4LTF8_9PEZI|nr:hypothetical protein L211DRAFT_835544 [Terfezia boudieri ATCC MYA-4762]